MKFLRFQKGRKETDVSLKQNSALRKFFCSFSLAVYKNFLLNMSLQHRRKTSGPHTPRHETHAGLKKPLMPRARRMLLESSIPLPKASPGSRGKRVLRPGPVMTPRAEVVVVASDFRDEMRDDEMTWGFLHV